MLRSLSLVALVLGGMLASTGCYQPSLGTCEVRCNPGAADPAHACPAGLVCSNGRCAAAGDTCSIGPADDGGPADARPDSACGWSVSNVDACLIQATMLPADWTVATHVTIDTDTGMINQNPSPASVGMTSQLTGGPEVALIFVNDLIVEATGSLVVIGSRPLIILAAGMARIDGPIDITPTVARLCPAPTPMNNASAFSGGAGGGGGGFGTAGASGGTGHPTASAPAVGGGGEAGAPSLEPLRPGCAGGQGEAVFGGMMSLGGTGGGAIQISARGALQLASSIEASGQAGADGAPGAGGGGAGAGGAILLEAATITLTNARLCANGGYGGMAFSTPPGITTNPFPSVCDGTPASNPSTMQAESATGGDGGAGTTPPTDGKDAYVSGDMTIVSGGAGGGGAVGRIRLNGEVLSIGSPVISPPATTAL